MPTFGALDVSHIGDYDSSRYAYCPASATVLKSPKPRVVARVAGSSKFSKEARIQEIHVVIIAAPFFSLQARNSL